MVYIKTITNYKQSFHTYLLSNGCEILIAYFYRVNDNSATVLIDMPKLFSSKENSTYVIPVP